MYTILIDIPEVQGAEVGQVCDGCGELLDAVVGQVEGPQLGEGADGGGQLLQLVVLQIQRLQETCVVDPVNFYPDSRPRKKHTGPDPPETL